MITIMHTYRGQIFTLNEAVVLTEISLRVLDNAIGKKKTPTMPGKWAGNAKRLLDLRALMLLMLERRYANHFKLELRRELVNALETSTSKKISLKKGFVTIDLRELRRELAASLRMLRRIRNFVSSDPDILDSEPVLRSTCVPVYLIATLLREGLSEADLLKRYPSLTAEMVRLVPIYAATYPVRGRSRTYLCYDGAPIQSTYRKLTTIEALAIPGVG